MASTSAWRPQEAPLRQLISYLVDSLSGLDRNVQRNAEMVSQREGYTESQQKLIKYMPKDAQASEIDG